MRSTKVLVTGGAGFIGRSLVKQLVGGGYEVVVLDNFVFSNQEQLELNPNVKLVVGDTRDRALVRRLVDSVHHVIHLAAASSFLMHKNMPDDDERDLNACELVMMGFKNVLEALRICGHKKLVWASTSAVYEEWAKWPEVPFVEKEPWELNPPDSKAGCKHWCELEARRYSNRHGITSVALRPFSVYGVGEHTKRGYANIVSLFTWVMMRGKTPIVWGDGSQTRDFIFVDDCARAFMLAMENSALSTTEINVGSGKDYSFLETIDVINQELGLPPSPKLDYVDVPIDIYAQRLLASTERAESLLGFRPEITLQEGVRRIIEATRKLPEDLQVELADDQQYFRRLKPEKMVPLKRSGVLV